MCLAERFPANGKNANNNMSKQEHMVFFSSHMWLHRAREQLVEGGWRWNKSKAHKHPGFRDADEISRLQNLLRCLVLFWWEFQRSLNPGPKNISPFSIFSRNRQDGRVSEGIWKQTALMWFVSWYLTKYWKDKAQQEKSYDGGHEPSPSAG